MTRKEEIEYVKEVAEDYGVDFQSAMAVFDILGPSEMYDGFISSMEDMEMCNC